jgi:uncharacterized tellurite resistance protein B-like protein
MRCIAGVAFALMWVGLPALLFARAGGGQSYSGSHSSHSSGSHSGGGGGGGDGILWLVFQLIRLCFIHPLVGLPVLAVVVAFIAYAYRNGMVTYQASVIRRGSALADVQDRGEIVARLRENDPAFDDQAFAARVRVAFVKIQEAWCGQNLTAVRPFISDGVYERFSLQFDEQRAQGLRNQMDNLQVGDIEVASGYADRLFDVLSIGIEASATDSMVSIKDGKRLSGSTTSEPFAEVWSFIRRRGAKTQTDPSKPGLIEGNCPNCGGAIELNQNANCQYCGAILRSGQYDWVLAEITQECEWQPYQHRALPGVEALVARDPDFNLQAMEDRASVLFWRIATAERLANTTPLTKAALPEYLERYQADLNARRGPHGERVWQGERAVGSVDTLGIILAEGTTSPDAAYDRALLEIRWSGTRFTADGQGRIQRHEQSAVSHLLLVLARKTGVKSDTDKSISSAHCPTCGAPEGGGTSGVCEFCGATLNDGSQTWALMDSMSLSSPRAVELLSEMRRGGMGMVATGGNGNGAAAVAPASALAWMVKMSLADGQLDDKERELLASYASKYRIPAERLDQLIAAARANELDVPLPTDRNEARVTLTAMARAALADGRISREEQSLLEAAGQHLGLSDRDVTLLLRHAKAELFADARQALRAGRNGGG